MLAECFWFAVFIVGLAVSAFVLGRAWGEVDGEIRQLRANWRAPEATQNNPEEAE